MIVVTTPTGAIGRQVVAALLAADAPVRVIARDPSKVGTDVEVVAGSHGDASVLDQAFAGADAVFWLPPPTPGAPTLAAAYTEFSAPAAQALVRHGVGRVVGVSALGRGTAQAANAGHVTASLAMDDLLGATGVPYRALTMPSFMDNLLRQVAPIATQGVFFSALDPDLKLPTCATADIAAAAVELLLDDTWTGVAERPVLGPEDLSVNDQAAILSEVLERPIRCQPIPLDALREQMLGNGASPAMAQGMVDMVRAKSEGLDSAAPRTPESSTPTTFRQWATDVLKPAVLAV